LLTITKSGVSAIILALALHAGTALQAQDASKSPASNPQVEQTLHQMDEASRTFRTTEASFVWDQYQKVVNDTDTQKGKIYYRRQGKEVQMAADISEPKKYVLFSEGKVSVYEPNMDRVTEYNVAKNRADVESLLILGFGGSGHDLLKAYDVSSLGNEQVSGINASKLQLVPKSQKVKNNVESIVLWIDPARGISVQQQFFQPGGDYRLAKYSDIRVNQKIPDGVFKLKTTNKTKFLSPSN
jgi:outer membrane lipoprotein-sorting protein